MVLALPLLMIKYYMYGKKLSKDNFLILSATTEIYGQSTIFSVHIVNTFFWRILQYASVLCYYFILFDDKILLDIKIFNK